MWRKSIHMIAAQFVIAKITALTQNWKCQAQKKKNLLASIITQKEISPYTDLCFSLFSFQAMNPFYVFQIYSVCLWIFGYWYIYFSLAIVFMSLISITLTVYSTRQVS